MKYLVNGLYEDTEMEFSEIMTADEIFKMMDQAGDNLLIDVWGIYGYGEAFRECSFLRKGFFKDEPNKMCITGGGHKIFGYGTQN